MTSTEDFSSLNEYADIAYNTAKSIGFHSTNKVNLADYLMNLHSEISELWEAYRKNQLNDPCDKSAKMTEKLTCLEEELADIQIRLLDTVKALKVNLSRACRIKNAFNKTRPYRNGGKKV